MARVSVGFEIEVNVQCPRGTNGDGGYRDIYYTGGPSRPRQPINNHPYPANRGQLEAERPRRPGIYEEYVGNMIAQRPAPRQRALTLPTHQLQPIAPEDLPPPYQQYAESARPRQPSEYQPSNTSTRPRSAAQRPSTSKKQSAGDKAEPRTPTKRHSSVADEDYASTDASPGHNSSRRRKSRSARTPRKKGLLSRMFGSLFRPRETRTNLRRTKSW